ncbi:MAG: SRPBCC family protein [Symploca sp. SIO1B1]|nr:SRPBCC family protein [Symploca sp. SIO1C2]NER96183.1 SRPBCC family protein [Symploca sp. SIO1B1]
MTRVFTSAVINAPIAQVWMKIRDFNAMPDWHPIVADSYIENDEPSDKVGCIRNFNLKEGGNIRERLLTLSDSDYLFSYSILEAPMPVRNYVATLQLQPITDGDLTYAQWTANFDCDPQEENGLIELIGNGVFQTGFNSLNQIFSK